jgi:hypothetical protein
MSTITRSASRRINWWAPLIVTIVLTIVALLISPTAPFGKFWAPSPSEPSPTGAQVPFFILLNVASALTFGAGLAFLFFGYPLVKSIRYVSTRLARASHLSIAWLLFSWFPHDNLHLHNGLNLNGLIAIEYGFHLTLMIAGVILAIFFFRLLRQDDQQTSRMD